PYEYLVVFEKDKIKAILDDNDVDVWNGVTN
ncbi:immunity protein Imm33 domain-containing protein, partial [Bacillus sp. HC-TM]